MIDRQMILTSTRCNMRIFSVTIMLFAFLSLCPEVFLPQRLQKGNEWMDLLKHFTGKVSPENQKGMPENFFIKMSEKEITTFIQKTSMLKVGISEQEVLKLLGQHTSIQKSGSLKGNKITMIFWNYYLIKKDDNGVNEKYDAYLMLIFSPQKMVLTKIIFSKGSAYV